ncbi:hypothetical protein EKO27_g222 [Xylaria grammica]|uniref:Uncharacterized protein n=1 Tax=Xylaria grammica TaxID=363999 RepID=A0A439DKJ7_9PEZI|nr:hypothetical protein EKO27_g222 [Xylaria grammica]
MTSFGQLNASAATFRAEATNALVNVNLEFNVFAKRFINPPREYDGVGQHLATKRLQEAQDGVPHGVARGLGALFKDSAMLPSTPELIKTYGLRASEISRSAAANPKGNDSHGAFAGVIGADATTLWAAATSEGELEHDVLLAVGGDISRSDLFDWDASARAWLRVADQVMVKQQTQAKLIIDNLDIPVNSKPDTYDSVIDAWASSMMQMEKLLCGIPLQVYRGDILLGLLSWHLYPDMKCLFREERTVKQNDPLLTGRGILTLGLEPSPRVSSDPQSVYWALPLAYLRYYGRLPITRVRSMRTADQDRITIDEMLWAVVSSYILAWNDASVPTKKILEFVSNVAIELHYALGYDEKIPNGNGRHIWLSSHGGPSKASWLAMLSRACLQYKDRLHEERVRKLQALGRRFRLGVDKPFNGVFNVETYLRAARSIESKVKLLREIVSSEQTSTNPGSYDLLIVYKKSYIVVSDNGKDPEALEVLEFATALPEFEGPDDVERSHRRWIALKRPVGFDPEYRKVINDRQQEIRKMKERIDFFDTRQPVFTLHGGKTRAHRGSSTQTIVGESSARNRSTRHRKDTEDNVELVKMTTYTDSKSGTVAVYRVVFGSFDNVALLRRRDSTIRDSSIRDSPIIHQNGADIAKNEKGLRNKLTIREIMSLFQPESVDFSKCALGISITDNTLLAMTLIESLYRGMDNATIDVRAVQVNFAEAKWVRSAITQAGSKARGKNTVSLQAAGNRVPYLHTDGVDTATCFACIAMMETGSYNLDAHELRNVFGLCASDSLYIASCLLRDPADRLKGPPVQRFTGNIGRAGMAFMVPPNEPEIRRYDLIDEWYQYDHNAFTGIMEDCFEGTSLHLSFSEASQAVNVNFSGGRDVEAYFLETLISVYNRKEWIAELDILGLVTSKNLKSSDDLPRGKTCNCKDHSARGGPTVIIAIDNFAEMLVPPNQPGIIRAEGNWQARLAATALCLAKGYRVVIKAPNTCLACLVDMAMARDLSPSHALENKDVLMII